MAVAFVIVVVVVAVIVVVVGGDCGSGGCVTVPKASCYGLHVLWSIKKVGSA